VGGSLFFVYELTPRIVWIAPMWIGGLRWKNKNEKKLDQTLEFEVKNDSVATNRTRYATI
jgi:hypothetical protein